MESYPAAQCPICNRWIKVEGEPKKFIEHTTEDGGASCQGSGQQIENERIEEFDRFAL